MAIPQAVPPDIQVERLISAVEDAGVALVALNFFAGTCRQEHAACCRCPPAPLSFSKRRRRREDRRATGHEVLQRPVRQPHGRSPASRAGRDGTGEPGVGRRRRREGSWHGVSRTGQRRGALSPSLRRPGRRGHRSCARHHWNTEHRTACRPLPPRGQGRRRRQGHCGPCRGGGARANRGRSRPT